MPSCNRLWEIAGRLGGLTSKTPAKPDGGAMEPQLHIMDKSMLVNAQ